MMTISNSILSGKKILFITSFGGDNMIVSEDTDDSRRISFAKQDGVIINTIVVPKKFLPSLGKLLIDEVITELERKLE